MATVIGPTPPGTGVMKPAFSFTPEGSHWRLVTVLVYRRIKHLIRASSHEEMGIFYCFFPPFTFKVNVADEPDFPRFWILDAVYAYVNNSCPLFHHISGDQSRNP